jgi:hypothetical protein
MNNMKKFFAITATASLVTALAGSAQAQVQSGPLPLAVGGGSVTPVCFMAISSPGAVAPNGTGTKLGTTWGTNPEVVVTCNSATNIVAITGASLTASNSNGPLTLTGYNFTYGFGGGTGIYTTIPNNNAGNTTFNASGTTQSTGDRFKLNALVEAPGNSLLLAGTYTTTVNLSLTP